MKNSHQATERHGASFSIVTMMGLTLLMCPLYSDAKAADDASHPEACNLLTLEEVQSVFADAVASKPVRTAEEYGVFACDWSDASDIRVAELRISTGNSAQDEVSMFEMGISDPLKPETSLRQEAVAGLDGATSLFATEDPASGVLGNLAILAVQKGKNTISIVTSKIQGRDRAELMEGMKQLATSVSSRY